MFAMIVSLVIMDSEADVIATLHFWMQVALSARNGEPGLLSGTLHTALQA
jgi:hypothetical protein